MALEERLGEKKIADINELKAICEELNDEIYEAALKRDDTLIKLEKICIIFQKIKTLCKILIVIGAVIVVFGLILSEGIEIPKYLDDFCGVAFLISISAVGINYLCNKLIGKIIEKVDTAEQNYNCIEETAKERYIIEVFKPYVALRFHGNYRKGYLPIRGEEYKDLEGVIMSYEGSFGVCNGINFQEDRIVMYGEGDRSFSGTVFRFDNPKRCNDIVYVQNKKSHVLPKHDIPVIQMDYKQFRDEVLVKSNDKTSAFKILTPRYMEQVLPYMAQKVEIPAIIYGKESVIVFVENRYVERYYTPVYPLDLEQCEESVRQARIDQEAFIKDIYEKVVESMR